MSRPTRCPKRWPRAGDDRESGAGDRRPDPTASSPTRFVDPDAAGSEVSRQELYDRYGLQPFAASLFSGESYYLYMVLEAGDKAQVIYPRAS